LTETAATSDLLAAIEALRPLHETGVRLSIDDFGTGYTSLSALPHLPLDELKIDQSFVRRVITSSADEAIVRSVTELAHRLGLTVVAEGSLGIGREHRRGCPCSPDPIGSLVQADRDSHEESSVALGSTSPSRGADNHGQDVADELNFLTRRADGWRRPGRGSGRPDAGLS